MIDLHIVSDISGIGTTAAVSVYAVIYQETGVSQGLVPVKARLAKKGLTIPRLQLVSLQMAAILVVNVRNALLNINNSSS